LLDYFAPAFPEEKQKGLSGCAGKKQWASLGMPVFALDVVS
jgi:hypothetical protein